MQMSLDDYNQNRIHRTLSGEYLPHGDPSTADCIFALPFGLRTDNGTLEPGLSNVDLARHVLAFNEGLEVVTHEELALALDAPHRTHLVTEAREPGARIDTTEFLEQAHEWMQANGAQHALLIAHPNHITWVDYICEHLGIATIAPAGLGDVRFDPHSDQYWTRSLAAWREEVLARQTAGTPRVIQRDET